MVTEKRILLATMTGYFVYDNALSEQMMITPGVLIGTLVPEVTGFYAEVTLPSEGEAEVTIGNEVLLTIDAFSPKKFGYLVGTVSMVYPVPTATTDNASFRTKAIVQLPEAMITTTDISLKLKHQMSGTAKIRVEPGSLFSQFINSWIK